MFPCAPPSETLLAGDFMQIFGKIEKNSIFSHCDDGEGA
jgi:hypothetical protein